MLRLLGMQGVGWCVRVPAFSLGNIKENKNLDYEDRLLATKVKVTLTSYRSAATRSPKNRLA